MDDLGLAAGMAPGLPPGIATGLPPGLLTGLPPAGDAPSGRPSGEATDASRDSSRSTPSSSSVSIAPARRAVREVDRLVREQMGWQPAQPYVPRHAPNADEAAPGVPGGPLSLRRALGRRRRGDDATEVGAADHGPPALPAIPSPQPSTQPSPQPEAPLSPELLSAELLSPELLSAELSTAELSTAELSTAELLSAELPSAELPSSEPPSTELASTELARTELLAPAPVIPESPNVEPSIDAVPETAPLLTRAARRDLERAAQQERRRAPSLGWLPAAGAVLLGFLVVVVGLLAVSTGQLARLSGVVALAAGGMLLEQAWRGLLNPGRSSRSPRSAWARMPWVPIGAVAVGLVLALLHEAP